MFVKAFNNDNLNWNSTFVVFSYEFGRKIALHSTNSADNIKKLKLTFLSLYLEKNT